MACGRPPGTGVTQPTVAAGSHRITVLAELLAARPGTIIANVGSNGPAGHRAPHG
jgi:hypothetical protein